MNTTIKLLSAVFAICICLASTSAPEPVKWKITSGGKVEPIAWRTNEIVQPSSMVYIVNFTPNNGTCSVGGFIGNGFQSIYSFQYATNITIDPEFSGTIKVGTNVFTVSDLLKLK